MVACVNCSMLSDNFCTAHKIALKELGRQLPPPPLGACMIPIVEEYLNLIQPSMEILDIGCGSWNRIKTYCNQIGAHYEGIDTQSESRGEPTVATRIENLSELSFDNNVRIQVGG